MEKQAMVDDAYNYCIHTFGLVNIFYPKLGGCAVYLHFILR